MDVGAAFIANGQTPEAAQPRQRPLHHPAMATQALAGVNAFPRNAHLNVPAPQGCSAARVVVALIRMEFGGRLRRCPAGVLISGMASSRVSKTTESWRLAPVKR